MITVMNHDDVVRQAIEAVEAVDERAVASAWLANLSSRDLAARAAFGCYVVLQHLAEHEHTPSRFAGPQCGVCRLRSTDVTLMTADELAECGFQHYPTNLDFAVPVLTGFPRRAYGPPTEDDHDRLRGMLAAIRALSPTARLGELNQALRGVLPSNKRERTWLLETLGYAGILCPPGEAHYSAEFVPADLADTRYPEQKSDWQYPIRFWTGADGVRDDLVARYFGGLG